jgi:fido (protein-threonine AMPylation protein)
METQELMVKMELMEAQDLMETQELMVKMELMEAQDLMETQELMVKMEMMELMEFKVYKVLKETRVLEVHKVFKV